MRDSPTVSAVLLAAGRAERFGGAKLGASLGASLTVLARSVLGLLAPEAGLTGDVWLVGRRAEAEPWLAGLFGHPRVHLVEVHAGGGQGDSVAAGARAVPEGEAVLVALGDQPLAAPRAVAAVLARYRQGAATAVAAACDGHRMPPVVFGPKWRARLSALTGDEGARAVLADARPALVELGQGAWALDLDRPQELARLREAAARDPIVCGVLEVGS